MLAFLKKIFNNASLDYKDLLERGAIIIDVRTPGEFAQGHVKNSINIPLNAIQNNLVKIRAYDKPIITCCRSGMRSGSAATILNKAGIEAYNGGSWNQVQRAKNNGK